MKVTGAGPGESAVRLVDAGGEPVAEVDGFLRPLAVREYSPNTIRAYAHDLQKLFAFLGEAGIGAADFTPVRAVEFLQLQALRPTLHADAPPCRGRGRHASQPTM